MRVERSAIAMLLLLAGAAAGCDGNGEPPPSRGATTPEYERVEEQGSLMAEAETPVRVGELGPNFPACYAMARFRDRVVTEGQTVAVRAAPFEEARETGRIASDGQFFICTRSHDQRWLAVIWDEAAGASRSCGVSQPVQTRRDYDGPCKSGWIQSALVRVESGIQHPDAPAENSTD